LVQKKLSSSSFFMLRSWGIYSKEPILLANIAWRANTITLFLLGS
jgi:hypothetical protein